MAAATSLSRSRRSSVASGPPPSSQRGARSSAPSLESSRLTMPTGAISTASGRGARAPPLLGGGPTERRLDQRGRALDGGRLLAPPPWHPVERAQLIEN